MQEYDKEPKDAPKIYFGELKAKRGKIHIVTDRCKGCGFCVEYCPKDVLEMSEDFNVKGYHPPLVAREEDCLYCQLCESICPEFALFVTQKQGNEE
jgi:2-oxoglutarate ferredoxin oxidoreductase subunit delta